MLTAPTENITPICISRPISNGVYIFGHSGTGVLVVTCVSCNQSVFSCLLLASDKVRDKVTFPFILGLLIPFSGTNYLDVESGICWCAAMQHPRAIHDLNVRLS